MSGVVTLDIPQNSPEWLAARQSRIGASEIGALACVSPFAGPADVWAAKVGPAQPRGRAELHHLVGHALEGIARDQWRARTGRDAVQGPVITEVGDINAPSPGAVAWPPTYKPTRKPAKAGTLLTSSAMRRAWSDASAFIG